MFNFKFFLIKGKIPVQSCKIKGIRPTSIQQKFRYFLWFFIKSFCFQVVFSHKGNPTPILCSDKTLSACQETGRGQTIYLFFLYKVYQNFSLIDQIVHRKLFSIFFPPVSCPLTRHFQPVKRQTEAKHPIYSSCTRFTKIFPL
jgi:hypothetical protein